MTRGQLAKSLELVSWSPADLARQLGCSLMPVRMMLDGRRAIDPAIAEWLEGVVVAVQAAPSWAALDRRYTAQD